MDNRTVAGILAIAAATLVAAGCASPDKVAPHSADEQKAINQLNSLTPDQQIERIQKGPMPQAAKDSMIQKIKDKAGTK